MPTGTVTVRAAEGEADSALSPDGHGAPARLGQGTLFDRLTYGRPAPGATTVPDRYDRDFDVVLDSGFGFADGQFTYGNTMNGRMAPDVPTLMVTEGDRVRVRITNRSVTDHPMHLHGHRVQVLSRDGTPATGSPWFTDTLNVAPGESYEVFFTADNPGIWMDHCHNFSHTAQGMIMHLAYSGVASPYHGDQPLIAGPADHCGVSRRRSRTVVSASPLSRCRRYVLNGVPSRAAAPRWVVGRPRQVAVSAWWYWRW
ncbi:hypothetical protein SFUMM280S_08095 [Streptomyces fumanus]